MLPQDNTIHIQTLSVILIYICVLTHCAYTGQHKAATSVAWIAASIAALYLRTCNHLRLYIWVTTAESADWVAAPATFTSQCACYSVSLSHRSQRSLAALSSGHWGCEPKTVVTRTWNFIFVCRLENIIFHSLVIFTWLNSPSHIFWQLSSCIVINRSAAHHEPWFSTEVSAMSVCPWWPSTISCFWTFSILHHTIHPPNFRFFHSPASFEFGMHDASGYFVIAHSL